ncbi:hypothetical protein GKE82_24900 [Conexibacter sp. W3-3-2]|nr:hypothetical protein [Conexibacter sp. W3-3-2]
MGALGVGDLDEAEVAGLVAGPVDFLQRAGVGVDGEFAEQASLADADLVAVLVELGQFERDVVEALERDDEVSALVSPGVMPSLRSSAPSWKRSS